jgi:hypothetical protein
MYSGIQVTAFAVALSVLFSLSSECNVVGFSVRKIEFCENSRRKQKETKN